LLSNETGWANAAVGYEALKNTTTTGNTAVGYQAGLGNGNSYDLTMIGNQANVGFNGLNNATAIGVYASVAGSNSIRLGTPGTWVYATNFVYTSDARFKDDVKEEDVPGLAFIKMLRPVTYN